MNQRKRLFLRAVVTLVIPLMAIITMTLMPSDGSAQEKPPVAEDALLPMALGSVTGTAVDYAPSPPTRELPASTDGPADAFRPPRINPLANQPDGGQRGTWDRPSVPVDRLIGQPPGQGVQTPALDFDFAGVGNPQGCGSCAPPDPNGDVGPNHYVQMVNATKVAIFDKSGVLLAQPFNLGSLWPRGTCASNAGDPIVAYDRLADRWLLAQFADPSHMCFAISQTADPLGSYHLYTFNVGSFPDYFKIGVWPDAYYMGANESTYTAYAFNRAKMLVGDQTANFVRFSGQNNFLLPANLAGPLSPPAGSPGYFYTFKDDVFHGGVDRIELFTLAANFTNPGQSTFTLTASLPVTEFTYTVCGFFNFNCAKQPGTAQRIDVVSEWPMHRFPYRNFDTHQTLLGNFTVGGGIGEVGAAIRWFELSDTGSGWTLFQEGTFDPGDGHDRFMGSIAMDGSGNIALGYSVSSSALFPGIRYATRAPVDPVGTLQPEAVLINGGGSQTGSNRWGDYSAMSVDPVDDCTFWYTNEYYPMTASTAWQTRIGVFESTSCGGGNQPPVAMANGPYSGTVGNPISFSSAGSMDPDGTIVDYLWNFGDGSRPSHNPNPVHVYSTAGTSTATLTVTDNEGATGTDTATVTVAPAAPSLSSGP
jgi:PKD domain